MLPVYTLELENAFFAHKTLFQPWGLARELMPLCNVTFARQKTVEYNPTLLLVCDIAAAAVLAPGHGASAARRRLHWRIVAVGVICRERFRLLG